MSEENQPVVSETVSEQPTQETPTQPTEVGALIAESKKYRKRSQDAEARIAELEKQMAQAEEAKLKEKEDFKALYEKVSSEKEILSSEAAKWQKYEEVKRASLLEQHPEEERESLKDLPLDTLEFVTSKIMDVKPNVPQVSGRTKNTVIEKSYSEMTPNERRNSWSDIVKSFNKK
tara:strand:+ start:1447 stop:1971 length:525 start_codon:yes stop_codon:yes gene_type:complete